MRKILVFLLLLAHTVVLADSNPDYKNMIGLESGMYHRGLLGVSYQRLYTNAGSWMAAAGGGAGIGSVFYGTNQFCFITASTGYQFQARPKETRIFAFIGSDLKYINYHDRDWAEETNRSNSIHFSGFAVAPYFGIGGFEKSVFFQLRGAPWLLWLGKSHPLQIGGVGITVGRRF